MHPSTLIKVLSGILLFIFVTILGILFTIFFIPPSQGEVEVPDVIGKDFETAYDILTKCNLKVKYISRFSTDVPPGYVFNQNPSPGRKVRSGRQIEVIVSRKKTDIVVPDLRGLTLTAAKNLLSSSSDLKGRLRIGYLAYAHSTTVKEGLIMAQSPLPMTKLEENIPVNLLISQGPWPESFEMPKLVGMELEDALQKIKELGLVISQIREGYEGRLPKEVVIDQTPPGGYRVRPADRVNLVISKVAAEEPEETRFEIIRFTVPKGPYSREVQIVVTDLYGEREIYNQHEMPGSVLMVPVKVVGQAHVAIYLDGELVEEKVL